MWPPGHQNFLLFSKRSGDCQVLLVVNALLPGPSESPREGVWVL